MSSTCSVDGPCNGLFPGEITLELADFPLLATDMLDYKEIAVPSSFVGVFPHLQVDQVYSLYSTVPVNKE